MIIFDNNLFQKKDHDPKKICKDRPMFGSPGYAKIIPSFLSREILTPLITEK
jgi:hypothetical protein